MSRGAKIFVLLLLVALFPARVIASVTEGFCSNGHQQAKAQAHVHELGDHGASTHHGEPGRGDNSHACSYCAAHCAGASLAVSSDLTRIPFAAAADRIPFGVRAARGFVPDHLDRPPLPL